MVQLDGVDFTVLTPQENTQSMLDYINRYLSDNQVKNKNGNVIQIATNFTNPLYLFLWGAGYIASIVQRLIFSIGCNFSIASSSERQLNEICQMMGVERRSATKTTMVAVIQASGGVCKITKGLSATVKLDGKSLAFSPAFEIDIQDGELASVVLVCSEEGSYEITAGTVTQFDENPENMGSLNVYQSTPGRPMETVAELRQRLVERSVSVSQIERCIQAIRDLSGVTSCNIYYNDKYEEYVFNGITMPPRSALLYVVGYDDKIGETYCANMMCRTAPVTHEQGLTAVQNVQIANQTYPVYIKAADIVTTLVAVFIKEDLTAGQVEEVQKEIRSICLTLQIGEPLTSDFLLANLQYTRNFTVRGITIDGTYMFTPSAFQIVAPGTINVTGGQ